MSNKLSPAEIEKLIQSVKIVEERVDNDFATFAKNGINVDEKIVVFLLGLSGTGKTTLYYAITEKELKVIKERRNLKLESVSPEKSFPIMNGQCSYLNSPVLQYDEKNDIIFCDCPCFSDDRGDIQDIINSFSINRALSHAKKTKILLVVTENDIDSSKGKIVRDSCEMVENFIHNKQNLESTVALIISNVKPEYSNELFLEDIETGNSELLKIFKKRESGDNKLVFIFPSPNKEMVDGVYTGFESKDQILNFIHDCPFSIDLMPEVSLGLHAKLTISKSIDSFGNLSELLQQYIDQIQYEYSLSDDELEAWKDRIEKICNYKFKSPKDFVDFSKKIIPTGSKYEQIYNCCLKIDVWRSFLERICTENGPSNDKIFSRNSQVMSAVFLDISKFLSERLAPSLEIINNKIEKNKRCNDDKIEIENLQKEIQEKQEKAEQLRKEINDINKEGDEIQKNLETSTKKQEKTNNNQVEKVQDKGKTQSCLLL